MKITECYPRVYVVETKTKHEIASLFMRIQEFYESPHEHINGKYFTLDDYMDTYAEETGAFTYMQDWAGFNVPGNVVRKFFSTYGFKLRNKELELRDHIYALLDTHGVETDRFYLLGCSEESASHVLPHEIAHALWYLSSEYRQSMKIQMFIHGRDNGDMYTSMKKTLLEMGYCEDVLYDEIHAYLATSSKWDLFMLFGLFAVPWNMVDKLRNVYAFHINHGGGK